MNCYIASVPWVGIGLFVSAVVKLSALEQSPGFRNLVEEWS